MKEVMDAPNTLARVQSGEIKQKRHDRSGKSGTASAQEKFPLRW